MDFGSIVTQAAALVHMQPSTLLFWLLVINQGSRVAARRIPDNATGFWGFMRQTFAVLGTEVDSKLTADTTVKDVAKAALETPPIPEKVEAAAEAAKS